MSEERLLPRLHTIMRLRHYSARTERAYLSWVVRYVRFCRMRDPRTCGSEEVCRFLETLAKRDEVAASTQNQALAALLFLYREVLGVPLPDVPAFARAKRPVRIPEVLEPAEVQAVLSHLDGVPLLVAQLLYGAGLRLSEAVTLRVKDLDLAPSVVVVRNGKGGKDRRSVLPASLLRAMRLQVDAVHRQHAKDLLRGARGAWIPDALDRKYPHVCRDWRWAWLFPSERFVRDPRRQVRLRWHVYPTTIQRAVAAAARSAGINKRVTPHIFRHSFATQLLRSGYDIRTVQTLLGHRDVSTTMLYLHVLETGTGVRSPLDQLAPVMAERMTDPPAPRSVGEAPRSVGEAP